MPIFAAFMGLLIGNLTAFFAAYVTRRIAVAAAGVTVAALMTAALWATLTGLQACCSMAMPALSHISMGLHMINMAALKNAVACIIGIEIAVTLYRWQRQQLRMITAG